MLPFQSSSTMRVDGQNNTNIHRTIHKTSFWQFFLQPNRKTHSVLAQKQPPANRQADREKDSHSHSHRNVLRHQLYNSERHSGWQPHSHHGWQNDNLPHC